MAHTPESSARLVAETPTARPGAVADAPADPGLHRGLSKRHIMFIALGTAIGTGLFYGSAGGIQTAGPGVILSFAIAGLAVFLVMRALGEMAMREPVSGSFAAYASRYLGPYAGYLTGWTFVFELAVVIVADTFAITKYMELWFPAVPAWAWVAATIVVIGLINLIHVGNFGEVEFWLSLIKVLAIVAMIFGGVILMFLGAQADDGTTAGLHNLWSHGGFLPMGFAGVIAALTIVTFSFGGIETLGVAAGEAKDPEEALPKAINTVPVRILLFYVGTMVVIMSLMSWQSIDGSASPFVQIFDKLGVPFAPHLLNFVVLTAAIYLETVRPKGYRSVVGPDGAIDANTALFQVIEQLPGGVMMMIGFILLSAVFFVTSSDSGSLVMGMLATGGDVNPKVTVRIFFAIATAFMAAALLMAGGLSAIQTLAITIGLPFSVMMLVMCVATLRVLSYSVARVEAVRRKAMLGSIKDRLGLDTDDPDVVEGGPVAASQWWASLSRDHQRKIAQMASPGPTDEIRLHAGQAPVGGTAAGSSTRLRRAPRD